MPVKVNDAPAPVQAKQSDKSFGKTEEKAIISLAFDQPDFFASILPYLKAEFFEQFDTVLVFTLLKYHYDKDNVIISRGMCRDIYAQSATAEDPHQEIVALIERESDPREVPVIRSRLVEWAKRRCFSQLYTEESIEAADQGNYEKIEKIIDDAHRLTNMGATCHFMFDELDALFIEENEIKLTTGFPTLDRVINEGGPIRGDSFCWMAPTGVGKSIALVNSGAANVKKGLNVLHVTLEMSFFKTALRYLGCFTEIPIKDRKRFKEVIFGRMNGIRATYGGELVIVEWPPDEISVNDIHAVIDNLRKLHGIKIDVVCIDYLELMMSRVPANNKEEYIRQKRVSTEICRLALKENVLVFTASQTNRSGNENQDSKGQDKVIDINKVAESYGKTMPLSYIVTINQTKQEYDNGFGDVQEKKQEVSAANSQDGTRKLLLGTPDIKNTSLEQRRNTNAICRFYIVKNRNGPKFEKLAVRINYETMGMKEADIAGFNSGPPSTVEELQEV